MTTRDYSQGYAAQTDDTEIRDGTELTRGEGIPAEWFEGDSLHVEVADGRTFLFMAMPERAPDLFSWGIPGGTVHLAYLDRVNGTTVRVRVVTSAP